MSGNEIFQAVMVILMVILMALTCCYLRVTFIYNKATGKFHEASSRYLRRDIQGGDELLSEAREIYARANAFAARLPFLRR